MVGSTVRVRVPVRSAVADPNAPDETVSVEGQLLESGDTLVLAASIRREISAFQQYVRYDTFRIARSETAGVEFKEFSSGRSVFLGVVVASGTGLLALAALGLGGDRGGDNGDGDGNGTSGFTVPLMSAARLIWGWSGR